MAVLAPIPQRSEFGFRQPQVQPDDVFAKTMNFLKSILNAPGADALMGGPWGALGVVRPFFHGTTREAADSILQQGFKPSERYWGSRSSRTDFPPATFFSEVAGPAGSYLEHPKAYGDDVLKAMIDDERLLDKTGTNRWQDGPRIFDETLAEMRQRGLGGIRYGNETLVLDPSVIQSVERHK